MVALCADGIPAGFEARVRSVVTAQKENAAWLADSIEANIAERSSLSKGKRKVHRLSRSYGNTNRPMLKRSQPVAVLPRNERFSGLA